MRWHAPVAIVLALISSAVLAGVAAQAAQQTVSAGNFLEQQRLTQSASSAAAAPLNAPTEAEKQVLQREQRIESLANESRVELGDLLADDLIYISSDGAVHDKQGLLRDLAAIEGSVGSWQVTERRIRMYGDLAVVTAKQELHANPIGKALTDSAERYTRVWVLRNGKWQAVSFQATRIAEGQIPTAGLETCSGPDQKYASGSTEQLILDLEDKHTAASISGEAAGTGWLSDEYLGINGNGLLADKAFVTRLYARGAAGRTNKFSDRRVRVYGDAAVLTATWCLKQIGVLNPKTGLREGTQVFVGVSRITRVWAKKGGEWQVVSWQGTPIPPESVAKSWAATELHIETLEPSSCNFFTPLELPLR